VRSWKFKFIIALTKLVNLGVGVGKERSNRVLSLKEVGVIRLLALGGGVGMEVTSSPTADHSIEVVVLLEERYGGDKIAYHLLSMGLLEH